jgi:hypothetical protein
MKTNFKQPKNYISDKFITDKQPDPKKHQQISFIKSAIRITGYALLPFDLGISCIILVFSELVGILEELV